jgi:hypothetical protein
MDQQNLSKITNFLEIINISNNHIHELSILDNRFTLSPQTNCVDITADRLVALG